MNNQQKTLEAAEIAKFRVLVESSDPKQWKHWSMYGGDDNQGLDDIWCVIIDDLPKFLDALADSKREIGELTFTADELQKTVIRMDKDAEDKDRRYHDLLGVLDSANMAARRRGESVKTLEAQLLTVTNELEGERERRKTAERLSGGAWMAGAESVYVDLEKERDQLKAQLLVITGERDGARKRWSEPAKRWRRMRKAVWMLVNGSTSFTAEYRCGVEEALGEIDTVAGEALADYL